MLFIEGFKISLMRYMVHRTNFILMWVQNLVHIGFTLASMEFIYYYLDDIMGWNKYEMIILISTTQVINAIYRGMIRPNHSRFTHSIKDGTFDFMLLKPVKSIFSMNIGNFDFSSFLGMILPITVIFLYIPKTTSFLVWTNIAMYSVLVFNGALIVSALMFLIYCMSFIFIQVDRLEEIYYTIMSIIEKPREIYAGVLSGIGMVALIPLMVIAGIPTEILLGKTDLSNSVWCIGTAIFLIALSFVNLKAVLNKYQGASS